MDPAFLQAEVKRLLTDSEVQKKSGIYAYLLTGEEKHLNIRQFDSDVALSVYHAQGGKVSLARVSLLRAGEKGSFFNEEKMAGLSCFAGVTRPGRFPDGNRCRVRGIPSFCTAANHFLRRWGQAGLTDPI